MNGRDDMPVDADDARLDALLESAAADLLRHVKATCDTTALFSALMDAGRAPRGSEQVEQSREGSGEDAGRADGRGTGAEEEPGGGESRGIGAGRAGQVEVRARQAELHRKRSRFLEQKTELLDTAKNSTTLAMMLLTMLTTLANRVRCLSEERHELLAHGGDPQLLTEAEHRLTRALDQEQRAARELEQARDRQRRAEQLAVRVQQRIEELTAELERLRAVVPGSEPTAADAGPLTAFATGRVAADLFADDVDRALMRASEVNDADGETLQRITGELQDIL